MKVWILVQYDAETMEIAGVYASHAAALAARKKVTKYLSEIDEWDVEGAEEVAPT